MLSDRLIIFTSPTTPPKLADCVGLGDGDRIFTQTLPKVIQILKLYSIQMMTLWSKLECFHICNKLKKMICLSFHNWIIIIPIKWFVMLYNVQRVKGRRSMTCWSTSRNDLTLWRRRRRNWRSTRNGTKWEGQLFITNTVVKMSAWWWGGSVWQSCLF